MNTYKNQAKALKVFAGARNVSVVHLTKSSSVELGKHGITVDAVLSRYYGN